MTYEPGTVCRIVAFMRESSDVADVRTAAKSWSPASLKYGDVAIVTAREGERERRPREVCPRFRFEVKRM